MADGDRPAFESLTAILQVRDLPEALAFYTDILGLEVGWTLGDPPTYACVCSGPVAFNFGAPEQGQTLSPSSVYITLTGIDAYYERIRARGAEIAVPIGDRPYGMRDFTAVDPSGNRLSCGQPTSA